MNIENQSSSYGVRLMVVPVSSLSTQEAATGGLFGVQVQLGLYGEYQASLNYIMRSSLN